MIKVWQRPLFAATYQPVNALGSPGRDAVTIRCCATTFKTLAPEHVVLIKKNVCSLLEPRLIADGFRVLNAGRAIYFPSHGRQGDFHRQFAEITLAARIGRAYTDLAGRGDEHVLDLVCPLAAKCP